MSTFRVLIASVILFCFFISCRKEDTPAAGDKFLQRIVSSWGDTISYSSYQYDSQKRLIAISDSSNNIGNGTGETFIEYDTNGNLLKFTHHRHYPNSQDNEWSTLLVYENGKVIQKLVKYSNQSSYFILSNYIYDMKGRLIRDSIDTYNYTDFVYDDNDNVVQAKEVTLAWGTTTNTSIKTASYNSDINPYNSLGLTLYFIRNYSAELLSKHTRTKVIYEQKNFSPRTGVYTYEYENGLPKKMTVTWDYEYPYLETVDFYYN